METLPWEPSALMSALEPLSEEFGSVRLMRSEAGLSPEATFGRLMVLAKVSAPFA